MSKPLRLRLPDLPIDTRLPLRDESALRPWYRMHADEENETAELSIFGEIGGGFFFDEDAVSARQVGRELDALPDSIKTIRVRINSPGGSAIDGIHIANLLQRENRENGRDVVVDIEGFSGSAATIVQMGGQRIRVASNALVFIHKAFFPLTGGNADQLRKDAQFLDQMDRAIAQTYTLHSPMSVEQLLDLMAADTTMDAEQAVENGFAHEVIDVAAKTEPPASWVPEVYRGRIAALAARPQREDTADRNQTNASRDAGRNRPDQENNGMPYLERVKSWFTPQANEESGDETPEASEVDETEVAADAVDVLEMCREADCLAIAEPLIKSKATREQAAAAVARAKEIRAICKAGEVPELAEGLIDTDMSVEATRSHVAQVTAHIDSTEIHGQIDPEASSNGKPRIDVVAVYQRLNGVTQTQEK